MRSFLLLYGADELHKCKKRAKGRQKNKPPGGDLLL